MAYGWLRQASPMLPAPSSRLPVHAIFGVHACVRAFVRADCLAPPQLIHAIMSVVASLTFAVVSFLLVMADHELEPMAKGLLAAPQSMSELKVRAWPL